MVPWLASSWSALSWLRISCLKAAVWLVLSPKLIERLGEVGLGEVVLCGKGVDLRTLTDELSMLDGRETEGAQLLDDDSSRVEGEKPRGLVDRTIQTDGRTDGLGDWGAGALG